MRGKYQYGSQKYNEELVEIFVKAAGNAFSSLKENHKMRTCVVFPSRKNIGMNHIKEQGYDEIVLHVAEWNYLAVVMMV